MGQVWTGYWGVTAASSWLFPCYPDRSRVGSLHHQHPLRIVDGIQALPMEFLGDTHHRMTQTPKTFLFPFQHLYVWLVDKILPDLRRGNKVKCAGQLSWLRCHCLFIVICQDWCVSRTKQAPVWKGCLMKETSFSFIVCLCASRGCVYLES